MGLKVLVIEDDAALNEIVCVCLADAGYACTPAFSGSEARMLLERCKPPALDPSGLALSFDLVITDLMLPGCPGEELVPLVRAHLGDVPVIVVSAKSAVDGKVALLRAGADDYLVKPFDLDELLARVDVQLRIRAARAEALSAESRFGGDAAAGGECADGAHASAVLRFGSWRLDLARRAFQAGGVPVKLTRTEFDILAALMAHPDRVFTKRELYLASCHDELLLSDAAAGAASVTSAEEKALTTHVGNLRGKLKATGTDDCLETVWGIGFKLRAASASEAG